jgi:acyl-CoA-dependent ceramide synthase
MFWFFLICRILARYVWKGIQKDDRSDDEEEEEEEKVEEKEVLVTANGTGMKAQGNGHLGGKPAGRVEVNERKSTLRKR